MIDWLARIVCSKVERGGGADDTADTDFVTHSAPCSSLCTRVSRRSLFVCIGEMLTQHPQRTLDNFSWWGVILLEKPLRLFVRNTREDGSDARKAPARRQLRS